MGLIKAALGSVSSVLADQWREYFYCESMDENILVSKGNKRIRNLLRRVTVKVHKENELDGRCFFGVND